MQIGDIVYVVWRTAGVSNSQLAVEVEVMGEPHKSIGWRGPVFKAKQLKKFSVDGWESEPDISNPSKVYSYRVKDVCYSKEEALVALQPVYSKMLEWTEYRCKAAQESLISAQSNVKHCLETLDTLKKTNLPALFRAGTEKYISIFTGNEI